MSPADKESTGRSHMALRRPPLAFGDVASEIREPCPSIRPSPVQVSSQRWSSRSSGARGGSWRKPRAARRVARRRSVIEMIAASSSSIDAARSVDEARGPRRGLASPSAAMERGSSRLVAPQAACRRPSRSVSGSRLEQGGDGWSRDEPPERGVGAVQFHQPSRAICRRISSARRSTG